MRGATQAFMRLSEIYSISIHAPHARSDAGTLITNYRRNEFQSTLLMRGATQAGGKLLRHREFQSTLLMRGATAWAESSGSPDSVFQSTLLMRGATRRLKEVRAVFKISIHAPHARSDARSRKPYSLALNFNPRSSCEERHDKIADVNELAYISIHAPHARSDALR